MSTDYERGFNYSAIPLTAIVGWQPQQGSCDAQETTCTNQLVGFTQVGNVC